MTGRALLIGSQTYGLAGCDADVALMADALSARGFGAIDVRTGPSATRAGIIDGLTSLTAAVAGGDAVVVYYSGHGGRVARPDFDARKAAGLSPYFQFIVPFDMDDTAPGDFRGVLSEELTRHQRALTDAFRAVAATPNVTTIWDCCHSGYLARAVDARPKAVDLEARMFRIKGIREHAAALGEAAALGGAATNPDAVRLVACAPEQSAFELESSRGGRHGAFTDALVTVLSEAGTAPLPWSVIADLVRRRVRGLVPEQRPEVEGPAGRIAFQAGSAPRRDAVPVTVAGGSPRIEAAALLGVALGDSFDVLRPGSDEPVGSAVVSAIAGGEAVLQPSSAEAAAALAAGGYAVPRRVSVPPLGVAVRFAGPGAETLAGEIGASKRLRVDAGGTLAAVEAEPAGLVLLDGAGARWRTRAFADDDAGRAELVEALEAVAVGHRLLDLPSGEGPSELGAVVGVSFVAVADRRQLALHGERLAAGTAVALRLQNTGADPVFVWVFDVGVSGRSALLTNAAPSGTRLGAAGAEDDTLDVWGADGTVLFWPTDVPAGDPGDPPRPETFVVVTADRRSDLSSLASGPAARGGPLSALDAILAEARTGVREAPPADAAEAPLRYRLDLVEFFLSAAPKMPA